MEVTMHLLFLLAVVCFGVVTGQAAGPCNPNPCKNGGTCTVIKGLTPKGSFKCNCPAPWSGRTCQFVKDPPGCTMNWPKKCSKTCGLGTATGTLVCPGKPNKTYTLCCCCEPCKGGKGVPVIPPQCAGLTCKDAEPNRGNAPLFWWWNVAHALC